jgi:tripartite-type tricarboxylate transporter receptor subunit TctC
MQAPRAMNVRRIIVVPVLALIALATGPAVCQDTEGAFAGKTVKLAIGFPPGTGNDIYARLITRHLGRHIPGRPTVVPQNMPGAGGFKAAAYVYGIAPKDGTVLGFISQTVAIEEILENPAVQFKAARFGWIGRVSSRNLVSLTWHTSKVRTITDAQTTEAAIGTTGVGSATYTYPNVLNKVLGTKFRLVSGYEGNAQTFLAMERGEIEAVSAGWFTIKTTKQDWLQGNKINILVQYMAERHPDLPHVPSLVELARNTEDRQLLQLFASEGDIGTSILAPPDLPSSTLTTLRRAFDSMAQDPEFIADADKIQAERDAMSGERLQKLIEAVAQTPPAIVERAKSLLR